MKHGGSLNKTKRFSNFLFKIVEALVHIYIFPNKVSTERSVEHVSVAPAEPSVVGGGPGSPQRVCQTPQVPREVGPPVCPTRTWSVGDRSSPT